MLSKKIDTDAAALLTRLENVQGELAQERATHDRTKAQVASLELEVQALKAKASALEIAVAREKERADRSRPVAGSGRVIEAAGLAKFGQEWAACRVVIEGDRVIETRFVNEPGHLTRAMAESQRLWSLMMMNRHTWSDRYGPQPKAETSIAVPVPADLAIR